MNDFTLAEVFEEVYKQEFTEFDNAPKHFFSRRHRKAMNEILYPRNKSELTKSADYQRKIPIKRRALIALLAIILSVCGIAAGAAICRGFLRKEHSDNTQIFTVNAEKAPKTIEYEYYLPDIPNGYEPYEYYSDSWYVYTSYIDSSTNKLLTFEQDIKDGYNAHFDNEHYIMEELEINGKYSLCFTVENSGTIVWDNEDYILQVFGHFTKDELIELAESVRIKQ